jgi:HEAT repeat protein
MTLLSMDFLTLSLLAVTATSLVLLLVMVGLRIIRKLYDQHLARLDVRVRPLVLGIAVAEPEELDELISQVHKLRVFARQQAVDTAFKMLAEVNGESRRNLSALMIELGVVTKALRRTRSIDPVRRSRAAELLGLVNPPEAVEALKRLSTDSNREVRIVAVRGLGRTNTPEAVKYIESVLSDPSRVPPWLAGTAFLEDNSAKTFPLDQFLSNPSPVVRQTAMTLASLNPHGKTVELLSQCVLEDPDRLVRVYAARALGRIQSRAGVEPLRIAAMSDSNRSVRVASARALQTLPSSWTKDALVYLQSDMMDPEVRRAALPLPAQQSQKDVS